jgi:hypothetical protein
MTSDDTPEDTGPDANRKVGDMGKGSFEESTQGDPAADKAKPEPKRPAIG